MRASLQTQHVFYCVWLYGDRTCSGSAIHPCALKFLTDLNLKAFVKQQNNYGCSPCLQPSSAMPKPLSLAAVNAAKAAALQASAEANKDAAALPAPAAVAALPAPAALPALPAPQGLLFAPISSKCLTSTHRALHSHARSNVWAASVCVCLVKSALPGSLAGKDLPC